MAKIRSGVLGNIRGKVSGVVGSQWKDVNYLREYVKPANPQTAAQIAQRAKMTKCVAFAKFLVGPIFNAYTDKFQKSMSGFNFFVKQMIAAFVANPTFASIIITEGKLSAVALTSAVYNTSTGGIEIAWTENLGNNGSIDDSVYWCVYDKSTGLWYFADAEVDRDTELDNQTLDTGLTATDLTCYILVAKYVGTIVNMISFSDAITGEPN